MKVYIGKSNLKGEYFAPPSKSYVHRALIAASFCEGKSIINNIEYSDDILATISCLINLGVKIIKNSDSIVVEGIGTNEKISDCNNLKIKMNNIVKDIDDNVVFNCNECGTTLRLFIPIAFALGIKAKFVGTKKLLSRPLDIYKYICNEENGLFEFKNDSLYIDCKLTKNLYEISGNISSQFITGMIFALSLLKKNTCIIVKENIESKSYIDMTIFILKIFGVNIRKEIDNNVTKFYICENSQYKCYDYEVEGDYSNSSFFEAMNLFSNINIKGLKDNSLQGDKIYFEYFKKIKNEEHPVLSVNNCIDLAPILCVYLALNHGGTLINIERLKIKESDRINSMKIELKKCGVKVIVNENEMDISIDKLHAPNEVIASHNDHRIVMAMTVLGLYIGDMEIDGAEAINKSYKDFFKKVIELGGNIKEVY